MRLSLYGVTKKFFSLRRIITAVDDVTFDVHNGEFFVLLGPSGCGKSTILNLIAGLEKPTKGEIYFDDELVASPEKKVFLSPRERNVAMVFQSYALYPHLSVFDNIAFPLRIAKEKEDTIVKAINDVAEMLGITELLKAKPGELSGGQRQRVAIARAIVRRPRIFLLDEPLSNLDAQLRHTMRTELKSLQKEIGITTLYVTHDQIEAMTLGDRIAVLKDGKVIQVGTPEELYDSPLNTFVATFIGTPQMNLFKAELMEEDGKFYIIFERSKILVPSRRITLGTFRSGQEIIVGIRPEDIELLSTSEGGHFQGKVASVEYLGRELLVHFTTKTSRFNALVSERMVKEGDEIVARINVNSLHLFEE
ncbi:MAG TPA: ABC transporter ATP-binding protein [Candidatus Hydrothermia bacterium]|nr:ABC transporter ATP-binding protein [Candidatus Hydrothermae bacterium]MDD3648651.1 ABC transporter ATP-binding protein [Candidatus Hydrothermia bacterium]HOK22489.1 ABC transporter ATP-binding protein [Candidatus Hydrothermia bacterium]HPO78206.1 ABC transporter ATP-binding protein [Candidatus Hydrothermia bacterium]HRD22515.1 ABC transporter ATP-binding protein [Candidatus Hydrothermia bacterium]